MATRRDAENSEVIDYTITVRLSAEEKEWLRRKAHWEGATLAGLLRSHVRALIAEEGYLRPPDDEPQDFGEEKEMIEFVESVAREQ